MSLLSLSGRQQIQSLCCDWLFNQILNQNNWSKFSPTKKQEVINEAYIRMSEMAIVCEFCDEVFEPEFVNLVRQELTNSKESSIQTLEARFLALKKWLEQKKKSETAPEIKELYAAILVYLTAKYFSNESKVDYFTHLNNLKALFSESLKIDPKSLLSNWGLGVCLLLQSIAIDPLADLRHEVSYKILIKAQEKLSLVASKEKEIPEKDAPLLRSCFFYLARTRALLNDFNGCSIPLMKAKLNGDINSLLDFNQNPDFSSLSSKPEFLEIFADTLEEIKERLNFEQDRAHYRDNQILQDNVDLEQSLTNSQIIQNALSTSTLDFISQQKIPLAVNLKEFFQPVINTFQTEAQARLKERMKLYGVKPKREIPGDGNCQMHSLSDQLCGNLSHSKYIRRKLISWLRANADVKMPNGCTLKDFVHDQTWEQYCAKMAKEGEWGDHLTLIAASEVFSARIIIISSTPGNNYIIEVFPTFSSTRQTVMLSHYAEFHYGSVVLI